MKVENNPINPLGTRKTDNAHPVEKSTSKSTEATTGASSKDKAELSSRARLLARAQQAMEEVPEVRSERVSELRTQVEDGTYQVPTEKLAQVLLPKLRNRG